MLQNFSSFLLFLFSSKQNSSKLMGRRKSMMKKKTAAASDTDSDTDSDSESENDNPNGVKSEAKLGRAKSVKGAIRAAKEMKELETNMDYFLKSKNSGSWVGTLNNNVWDAFRKSVQSLRTDTEVARGAIKEIKK